MSARMGRRSRAAASDFGDQQAISQAAGNRSSKKTRAIAAWGKDPPHKPREVCDVESRPWLIISSALIQRPEFPAGWSSS